MHAADDLIDYIEASPSPYHAVEETIRRLPGFRRLPENERWDVAPGDRVYVVRGDATIAAFIIGEKPLHEVGVRLIGAHTDSPNLRVKPNPDVNRHGLDQLAVEPYGGVLLATWTDRDLSLAGRVVLDDGRMPLIRIKRPLLRIPNLAIHLNRNVNKDGLTLNEQRHLPPLLGLERSQGGLRDVVATALEAGGVDAKSESIMAWDMSLYDTQKPTRCGRDGDFINAPRLDNLASCHAATSALASIKGTPEATCGIVLYDHEECGSRSAQGAASPFLKQTLGRFLHAQGNDDADGRGRMMASSFLVSADMAHAVHPNYAERHEPGHRPKLGAGPVIKINMNQSYATDGESWARFRRHCDEAEVTPQRFVTKSDTRCGSTIGPISAGQLGIRAVDVGNPMLSMHSCREMAASADVAQMISVFDAFFAGG